MKPDGSIVKGIAVWYTKNNRNYLLIMTQEEAKKFLMNKKVFVKDKSKEIQEKLFELGFGWDGGSTKRASYLTKPFLFMYEDMKLAYDDDVDYFYEHNYEEISAEDILNIKVEHLPKTWEEFCKNNPVTAGEATFNSCNGAVVSLPAKNTRHSILDKCFLPSISAAEAHLALMQLHQLRDCYRGNVDPYECQYAIVRGLSGLIVVKDINAFLSFPTRGMAEEFLANFKDLIEEAGDLI